MFVSLFSIKISNKLITYNLLTFFVIKDIIHNVYVCHGFFKNYVILMEVFYEKAQSVN